MRNTYTINRIPGAGGWCEVAKNGKTIFEWKSKDFLYIFQPRSVWLPCRKILKRDLMKLCEVFQL